MWCYDTCVSVGISTWSTTSSQRRIRLSFKSIFYMVGNQIVPREMSFRKKPNHNWCSERKNNHYICNLMECLVILNRLFLYLRSKIVLGRESGQTIIYCLRLVCHVLPVSLDCPFLIAPAIFSNVYIRSKWQSEFINGMNSNYIE